MQTTATSSGNLTHSAKKRETARDSQLLPHV